MSHGYTASSLKLMELTKSSIIFIIKYFQIALSAGKIIQTGFCVGDRFAADEETATTMASALLGLTASSYQFKRNKDCYL